MKPGPHMIVLAPQRLAAGGGAPTRDAMSAGRLAWLSGRIPKRLYATASSPETGTIAPTKPR